MRKAAQRPETRRNGNGDAHRLQRLRRERADLTARLSVIEAKLSKLASAAGVARSSAESFDRWLDDLTAGLPQLPPLPANFSRADLYDDHD